MESIKELKEQLRLLQAVLDNLPFDAWYKDEEGRYRVINKSFENYANKKKEEVIGKTDYDLYPENEATIYLNSDKETIKNKAMTLHKSWLPSGMYKEEGKTALFNLDGTVKGITGFSVDISDKELVSQALRSSEKHFQTIFELAPVGIAIYDSVSGMALEVNRSFCEILGRDEKEVRKHPWWVFSHKDEIEENKQKLNNMENNILEKFNMEKRFVRPDKSEVWVNMRNAVFEQNKGENQKHICMIEDITARKLAEKKILYLNYFDQLTGVHNRRYYETELKKINQKSKLPISLIMADVNGLKLINDAFGHFHGDQLLKTVSGVLKKVLNDEGFIARIGGDEFVLILPNTDNEETEKVVKKIQDSLSKRRKNNLIFSVSFGWCIKDSVSQSFKDVFRFAEDQMYKNKLSESSSMRSETIKVITNTLYEKNEREQHHCERVRELCGLIGKAMKMNAESINELKTAGLLHDIGKVSIDEHILNKAGKLTDFEWRAMKRHPEVGFQILRSIKEFVHISEYVLYHHEKVDGTGYPGGLVCEEIPLQSKIICIADAYDAMTSTRTYKNALTKEEAIIEIEKNKGSQFDPEIADLFIKKILTKVK